MRHLMIKAVAVLAFCGLVFFSAETVKAEDFKGAEPVSYRDGDTELQGYWISAACLSQDPPPVVLVVHQWMGISPHEIAQAQKLSRHCYDVFVIDIYGKGNKPPSKQEAGKLAGKYKQDPALSLSRMNAALDFVKKRGKNGKIAAIGYCFGGTMVLDLARSGAELAGVVSFHGGLATAHPAPEKGKIKAAVQVLHGAADPHVPPAEVTAFMAEMDAAGADWHLVHYAEAVHAFTHEDAGDDVSTGAAYNEKAAKRSWRAATGFLKEVFGGGY